MSTEARVAEHYTKGRLDERTLRAMAQAGKDLEHLSMGDLVLLDEFHIGGLESTRHLAAQMNLHPGMRLLDIGSGIGGPARYFASEHGCHVTGIDLTEEFVEVAASLTHLVKLSENVDFRRASGQKLPFDAHVFDGAYMIHVGMNIPDKAALFAEVHRVLNPGAIFALFDVMRFRDGPLRYPVPWALSDTTSFVAEPNEYCHDLERAQFEIVQMQNRRDFAMEATHRSRADIARAGPPVLGLQLLMGEKTGDMAANLLAMMEEGLLALVELLVRAI